MSPLPRLRKRPSSHSRTRRPAARPTVEHLEDRTVPAAITPPSGLIGWWSGDGHAADLVGNNDATLQNGATFAAGRVGQAFSLDGADDFVRVPHDPSLNPAAGLTIEAWIKSSSTAGARVIVSKWNDNTSDWSYIFKDHNNSDKLRIELSESTRNDLADLQGNTSIGLGTWIHVAATYDTNVVRLYFNGAQNGSLTVGPNRFIDSSVTDLLIGAVFTGGGVHENFAGLIDEVSMYNRALSASEIQAVANAGADGKLKPMTVVGSSPAAGSTASTAPTSFVIDFSLPYNQASVQASDLQVNGVPADSVSFTDADTLTFTFSASPVTAEGLQTMHFAAGAVQTAAPSSNAALREWTRTFRFDTVPLRVVAATPTTPGPLTLSSSAPATLRLDFNEAVAAGSVGINDLTLSQGTVTGAQAIDADTVEYTLSGLGEGSLTVSVAAGALTDTHGNPSTAYSATYEVDVGTVAFPTPLQAVEPAGSLAYRGSTSGLFNSQVAPFVSAGSGGLNRSIGTAFGPDGNLYVSSWNSDEIMRYDGTTGAPLGVSGDPSSALFVSRGSGGLVKPNFITFGPDRNGDGVADLYVPTGQPGAVPAQVLLFSGATGASLGAFVPTAGNGGLVEPLGVTFGPDGHLYVADASNNTVLRYSGTTGAFLNVFVAAGSGGLNRPEVLTFGPDGRLYVSSSVSNQVLRYNGTTGAFLNAFVAAGSGGLSFPTGLAFGPDGKLYVGSAGNDSVLRYDGATGAFLDAFVPQGGGGLTRPTNLEFGDDGTLYVSTADTSQVLRFDGTNGGPGDLDQFTLDLDANQTLTLRVSSGSEATATLTHSVLGTIALPADQDPGPGRLYQTIALPAAGTLTVGVQALNGLTSGWYSVEATLNALLDQSSGAAPVAQSLDGSALDVDPGAGTLTRAAALGTMERAVPRITTETEGQLNDLRGSWDRVGSTTTWTINNGSGATGELNRKGNGNDASDSWRFDARAGDVVTVRTRASSSGGGTLPKATLTLQRPDGTQVVGTVVPGASSDYQVLNFTLTQTGSYTAIVGTDNGKKGTYTLTVNLVTPTDPRFLPDDVYTLTVASAGYVSLAALAGTSGQTEVQLALYAPAVDPFSGAPVATSAPRGSLDAWLEYAAAPGVYKVKVSPGPALTGGSVGYSLVATAGGVFENTINADFASAQDLTGRAATLGSLRATTTTFVAPGAGGLDNPVGLTLGPDGNLYVASQANNRVLRYSAATGALIGTFVTGGSGGLSEAHRVAFGPDGNLYVSSGNTDSILRYSGTTGAFLNAFVAAGSGALDRPHGFVFHTDGSLYVASANSHAVLRYSGTTGAFLGAFVAPGSGGLSHPTDLAFGPDGSLYVSSWDTAQVLRYDGTTGAFLGTFVAAGSGGLQAPNGLAFGPDGSLYVAGFFSNNVLRYHGATGAFLDALVPTGGGGLSQPVALLRAPDGRFFVSSLGTDSVLKVETKPDFYKITLAAGQQLVVTSATPFDGPGQPTNALDPRLELYGPSQALVAGGTALGDGRNEQVVYSAAAAGTYYIKVSRSGTAEGEYTLRLSVGSPQRAATEPRPGAASGESLTDAALRPLLREAIARWEAAGLTPEQLATLRSASIQIVDLGGPFLGMAYADSNAIALDDDAAGWGWFVDATPWEDSEFTTPGDQGEQGRMDLLTTLMHELGHLLGLPDLDPHLHAGDLMAATLTDGTRRTPRVFAVALVETTPDTSDAGSSAFPAAVAEHGRMLTALDDVFAEMSLFSASQSRRKAL